MKFTKNLIKKKVVVLASHMLYYTCTKVACQSYEFSSRYNNDNLANKIVKLNLIFTRYSQNQDQYE